MGGEFARVTCSLPLPPVHVWSQQSYLSILGCPGGLGCEEKFQSMGEESAESLGASDRPTCGAFSAPAEEQGTRQLWDSWVAQWWSHPFSGD